MSYSDFKEIAAQLRNELPTAARIEREFAWEERGFMATYSGIDPNSRLGRSAMELYDEADFCLSHVQRSNGWGNLVSGSEKSKLLQDQKMADLRVEWFGKMHSSLLNKFNYGHVEQGQAIDYDSAVRDAYVALAERAEDCYKTDETRKTVVLDILSKTATLYWDEADLHFSQAKKPITRPGDLPLPG